MFISKSRPASHHREIKTVRQLAESLRAGPYAWPGGYPLFYLTDDGATLSPATVASEFQLIARSIKYHARDGWRVVACDINWEDDGMVDEHTGKRIESAYGDCDDIRIEI